MTDTANAPAETPVDQSNADIVAGMATDFSFVQDKYRTEGRTDEQAAFEQAKAYTELQKKFGAFTGAPEEYELSLSEALSERINLDDYQGDPLLEEAKAIGKELGLNNEGLNRMLEIYFKSELAATEAIDQVRAEEMKALGNNAERRLSNIQDWAKANFDAETAESLEGLLTSAKNVQAVEALIAKTRNTSQVQNESAAPAISASELMKMQVAVDEFGNPKMNDPAYARNVRQMYDQLYGKEPRSVTVGR